LIFRSYTMFVLVKSLLIVSWHIVSSKNPSRTKAPRYEFLPFPKSQVCTVHPDIIGANTDGVIQSTAETSQSLSSLAQNIQQAHRSPTNGCSSKVLLPPTLLLFLPIRITISMITIPISVSFSLPRSRWRGMPPPWLPISSFLPTTTSRIQHLSLRRTIRDPNPTLCTLKRLLHPHAPQANELGSAAQRVGRKGGDSRRLVSVCNLGRYDVLYILAGVFCRSGGVLCLKSGGRILKTAYPDHLECVFVG